MSATSKEIINIRKGRHEEQTTSCTKWAIKVFQGKLCFKLSFKMSDINLLFYNYKVYSNMCR